MAPPESVAAVILAGGKSSRMGHDKASLRYHGQTLLSYMAELVRSAGIHPVYLNHPEGIADRLPGQGPLSGIHASLKALHGQHTHLLFIPVDMPALRTDLICELAAAPAEEDMVRFEDYILPFRLRTDPRWITTIEPMLAEGRTALKQFQKPYITELPLKAGEHSYFQNLNTPEAWEAFTGTD